VLFAISGLLLWFGEHDTRLRFGGTIVLHDGLTLMATVLVACHLYLSLQAPAPRQVERDPRLGRAGSAAPARRRLRSSWSTGA
jgi:hypothetical protein